MSVDILGTSQDQCRSMVQYSFMSTETRRLIRTQPRTATSTLTQLLNYDVDVKHHVYLYACWSPAWQIHVWLLWLFIQKHLAICAQIFGLCHRRVHPFFCFQPCNWDQMGPTASADAPNGQQKLQSLYPQWWQFFLPLSAGPGALHRTVAGNPVPPDKLTSQSVLATSQDITQPNLWWHFDGGKKALAMCWWSSQSYFAKQLCRILKTALKCKNSGTLLGCMLPVCV